MFSFCRYDLYIEKCIDQNKNLKQSHTNYSITKVFKKNIEEITTNLKLILKRQIPRKNRSVWHAHSKIAETSDISS